MEKNNDIIHMTKIITSPEDGFGNVVRIFMVVLFPVPLGPRNPNTFP